MSATGRGGTYMRRAAIAGASFYLATLVAAPLVDRGIDPLRAYPEDYAVGAANAVVRVGYLAVATMALAIAGSLLRSGGWPRRVAATLLGAGSLVSLVLAGAPQQVTGGALAIGVLALVAAPLVVSAVGRDMLPRWLAALGIVVTLAFGALAVAPDDLAGITNRAWDVLLGVWGLAFAASAGDRPRASAVARGVGIRAG